MLPLVLNAYFTPLELAAIDAQAEAKTQEKPVPCIPPEPPAPPVEKEVLVLPGGSQSISDCAKKFFARLAETGRYFLRAGVVVRVIQSDGEHVFQPVVAEALRSISEKYFNLFVWRAGRGGEMVLKPCVMTSDQARGLFDSPFTGMLPEVKSLSACPLLLPDGRTITAGFDGTSGVFVTGCGTVVDVPLEQAVVALSGLLADFAFVRPGDKARALAALITPALRKAGFLRLCPMQINEADQSQTGKDFLLKAITSIYLDKPALITQRAGGVGSADESLSSRLLAGCAFPTFANWRGKIDSPMLEALLTEERSFPTRVPYRGEVSIDPSRVCLSMTSNASAMTRDLANRSYTVRLRKKPPGYQFQKYTEGDLLDHIRANQPFYLGAVFSVVRYWMQAGQPTTQETRHDFRQWARILDWITQNVFYAGPLLAGHEETKARLSDPAHQFARSIAVVAANTGIAGRGYSAKALAELAFANDVEIPGCKTFDESSGARIIGILFKRVLGDAQEISVDGYTIQVQVEQMSRPDAQGYFPMRHYYFSIEARPQ
ncbi:TPA: hypothetical protein DDW35_13045 [Candidatus Sumerlaeota bacterium]|nr:hypothetical protein [Candidatus Sumerlaeota bacterium]